MDMKTRLERLSIPFHRLRRTTFTVAIAAGIAGTVVAVLMEAYLFLSDAFSRL